MQEREVFRDPGSLEKVAEFHRLFDLPVLSHPEIPSAARCDLRLALLEEELQELRDAIASQDLVGVADAFCDLQYVLSGAILEFGMGKIFPEIFSEVHRSNMSKVCQDQNEALETQEKYLKDHGVESFILQRETQYLVYRTADGKVLKSVAYSQADITGFLQKDPES